MKCLLAAVIVTMGITPALACPPSTAAPLVESWYQRYLGRCAEPAGLQGWVCVIQRNGPLAAEAGILSSDEYFLRNGCTPEGFVTGLYVDVLGRVPAAFEVKSWLCHWNGDRCKLAKSFLCAAQRELALRAAAPPPPAPPPPIETAPVPRVEPLSKARPLPPAYLRARR